MQMSDDILNMPQNDNSNGQGGGDKGVREGALGH